MMSEEGEERDSTATLTPEEEREAEEEGREN